MKILTTITFCILYILFSTMCCSAKNNMEELVKLAVMEQLKQYPSSTLQDLYKSFFQDKFGPGHIISDTTAARKYLDRELASFEVSHNPEVEATGWQHNFYRINLSVIKEGIIPYHIFFNAFIESVNSVTPPSIEEWKNEWMAIEKIIESMDITLDNYNDDKRAIDSLLTINKFVVHHSKQYEETYQPHYRIISQKVFERDLHKYLK